MSAIKERPILFKGEMVRAILNGSKTQTRRMVKLPHASEGWRFLECAFNLEDSAHYHAGFAGNAEFTGSIVCVNCPYGKPPDPIFKNPGDRLWVRETWLHIDDKGDKFDGMGSQTYYSASSGPRDAEYMKQRGLVWRPSIFMPRWASRITLEITGVRVERLQDISEADARAEGVTSDTLEKLSDNWGGVLYRKLWESIHGPRSWDANPWVWVIEFRRLLPQEAQP